MAWSLRITFIISFMAAMISCKTSQLDKQDSSLQGKRGFANAGAASKEGQHCAATAGAGIAEENKQNPTKMTRSLVSQFTLARLYGYAGPTCLALMNLGKRTSEKVTAAMAGDIIMRFQAEGDGDPAVGAAKLVNVLEAAKGYPEAVATTLKNSADPKSAAETLARVWSTGGAGNLLAFTALHMLSRPQDVKLILDNTRMAMGEMAKANPALRTRVGFMSAGFMVAASLTKVTGIIARARETDSAKRAGILSASIKKVRATIAGGLKAVDASPAPAGQSPEQSSVDRKAGRFGLAMAASVMFMVATSANAAPADIGSIRQDVDQAAAGTGVSGAEVQALTSSIAVANSGPDVDDGIMQTARVVAADANERVGARASAEELRSAQNPNAARRASDISISRILATKRSDARTGEVISRAVKYTVKSDVKL